jgi:hypothetical protein
MDVVVEEIGVTNIDISFFPGAFSCTNKTRQKKLQWKKNLQPEEG